jgi:tRNA modification GTPase
MRPERVLGAARGLLADPIAAVATPPGRSALALLRLSGAAVDLDPILLRVCPGRRDWPDRVAGLVDFLDFGPSGPGESLDRCLAVRYRAPRSYTGEDVVEFTPHGNPLLVRMMLDALLLAGARPAGPGEFTRRALQNGRLGLLEAEAVDALVRAESADALRVARRHLDGDLLRRLRAWVGELREVAAALEAQIDFPEDVDESEILPDLGRLPRLRDAIATLAGSAVAGRRLQEGVRVAIAGPVNSGKSTLFNALLGQGRAIVAPSPGTTRDVVSETAVWDGVSFRLEDTAGLRDAEDPVEREGIARSGRAVEEADVVLDCRDGRTLSARGPSQAGLGPASRVAVATHADLLSDAARATLRAAGWRLASGTRGDGIEELRACLLAAARAGAAPGELLLHSARQQTAVAAAAQGVAEAVPLSAGEPVLAAGALLRAARVLEELCGEHADDSVLDSLFARFCVGK